MSRPGHSMLRSTVRWSLALSLALGGLLTSAGVAVSRPLEVATDPPPDRAPDPTPDRPVDTRRAAVATTPAEPAPPRVELRACVNDPYMAGSLHAAVMNTLRMRRLGDVLVTLDCGAGQIVVRLADRQVQRPLPSSPSGDTGSERIARRVDAALDELSWQLADDARPVPRLPGPRWAWHASIGARALPESGAVQQVMHMDVGRALISWLWLRTGLGLGFGSPTEIDGGELSLVSGTAVLGLEARMAGPRWSTGLTVGGRGGIGFALSRAPDATLDEDVVGAWGGPMVQAAAAAVFFWPLEVRVTGELGWALAELDGELAGEALAAFRGMWVSTGVALGAVF